MIGKKTFTLLIILLIILVIISVEVLYPSYISYASVCKVGFEDEIIKQGYKRLGSVEQNTCTGEVRVVLLSDDPKIIKHECIHINQIIRGYPKVGCDTPFQKILAEIEAYTFSTWNDKVYRKVYGGECLDSINQLG